MTTSDAFTESGTINLLAGASSGDAGGDLCMRAGRSVGHDVGGEVDIAAGKGSVGGAVKLSGGFGECGDGGSISFDAGAGDSGGVGGSITLESGASGSGQGGSVFGVRGWRTGTLSHAL